MHYIDMYNEYLEKLLLLQFEASEIFEHKLTKGEVREDFIKQIIKSLYEGIKLYKGCIICEDYQSSQLDIIAVNSQNNPRIATLGNSSLINIKDAKIIVEVKSRAKTSEVRDLDELAERIKGLTDYNRTKIGMFMYDYEISKINMLKKFGYKYDSDLDTYTDELTVDYPNIDFIVSLDINMDSDDNEKSFFIIKDDISNRFVLYKKPPMSKYFFDLFGD